MRRVPSSPLLSNLGDSDAELSLDVNQLAASDHPPTSRKINGSGKRPTDRNNGTWAKLEDLAGCQRDPAYLTRDLYRQLAQEVLAWGGRLGRRFAAQHWAVTRGRFAFCICHGLSSQVKWRHYRDACAVEK